jgi:hypothetical protein
VLVHRIGQAMDSTRRAAARERRRQRLYNQAEAPIDRDRDRLLQFQLEGGDGPTWKVIRDDAWSYAVRVLQAMLRDGRAGAQHRRLGGFGTTFPSGAQISSNDADELAHDVASGAITLLQHQLRQGRWDPQLGTTIGSWFVNLCILRTPRVWRQRRRAQLASGRAYELNTATLADPGWHGRPEASVYELEFERYIDFIDDEGVQQMVRLDADGYTDRQIAELVTEAIDRDITTKVVEYQLAKARTNAQARQARERARESLRDIGGPGA